MGCEPLERLTKENEQLQTELSDAKENTKNNAVAFSNLSDKLDKHRWIPVSERLPEETGSYETTDGQQIFESMFLVPMKPTWPDEPDHCPEFPSHVTHWKPIIMPKTERNE